MYTCKVTLLLTLLATAAFIPFCHAAFSVASSPILRYASLMMALSCQGVMVWKRSLQEELAEKKMGRVLMQISFQVWLIYLFVHTVALQIHRITKLTICSSVAGIALISRVCVSSRSSCTRSSPQGVLAGVCLCLTRFCQHNGVTTLHSSVMRRYRCVVEFADGCGAT